MSKLLHTATFLLLSLLLTLTGCGDPVVDTNYSGEALLTVTGELRALPDYQSKGPLHVALVWFPKSVLESEDGAEVPDLFSVVTEDVRIEGSFPLDYRIDVFNPPPAEALGAWGQGLKGKGAIGLVMAYEDLNGNGKLDRIAQDGTPQDRIIGASIYEPITKYMVFYADTAQQGVPAGFSLASTNAQGQQVLVPASTKLPLTLTAGGDGYDALVCEAGWLTYVFMPVCGLGEGEVEGPPSHLSASGDITLKGRTLEVLVRLLRLDGERSQMVEDAEVMLGGKRIPYNPSKGAYYLIEDDSTLLTPGTSVELTASTAEETAQRTLYVPQLVDITYPAEGAQVSSASPFTVRWAASPDADGYATELSGPFGYVGESSPDSALAFVYTLSSGASGQALLRVGARGGSSGGFSSFWLNVTTFQDRRFTVVP